MKYFLSFIIIVLLNLNGFSQDNWQILNPGIDDNLHDIEFIDDNTGLVFTYGTGIIYKTDNSGLNWTKVQQLDSVFYEQIQFINKNTGWICGEHGKLYKTTDSGYNWLDISVSETDGNLLLYSMHFDDEYTGFLSGGVFKDKSIKPTFYKTSDGGMTWIEIYDDLPHMILNLERVNNNLWGTSNGIIIELNKLKNKWEYLYKDTLIVIGQIRDIEFADELNGIAISFNGKILRTDDGGKNWSIKEITKNRLRSTKNFGGNKWIIAGDNNKGDNSVIYLSEDDGNTWKKHKYDFPDIHRIALSDSYVWVAGKEGFIAKMIRE